MACGRGGKHGWREASVRVVLNQREGGDDVRGMVEQGARGGRPVTSALQDVRHWSTERPGAHR